MCTKQTKITVITVIYSRQGGSVIKNSLSD